MATITLKGEPLKTSGELPQVGSQAPDFKLTSVDLSDKTLSDFEGKRIVMNIFPSIDTGTCAASVRNFNKEAAGLDNTVILCISKDLPFAQARFCAAEGIDNVVVLSEYKDEGFSQSYPLKIEGKPLDGLFSRAVIVLDEKGKVIYKEQVAEVTEEPDYASALSVLKS